MVQDLTPIAQGRHPPSALMYSPKMQELHEVELVQTAQPKEQGSHLLLSR
jgi:hypothetical protein